MNGNTFDPIVVGGTVYDINHLAGLAVTVNILFNNGDTRLITIHMRPTNHLFSRETTDADYAARASLLSDGSWLTSYQHQPGRYDVVKQPITVREHRIFCVNKWGDSHNFPDFVNMLQQNPAILTILANPGDDQTCLSGMLDIVGEEDTAFLVFFNLNKVNSKEINMLIESAFCVSKSSHAKAQKILNRANGQAKPFAIAIKNVVEGRKPFESQTMKNHVKRSKVKNSKRS